MKRSPAPAREPALPGPLKLLALQQEQEFAKGWPAAWEAELMQLTEGTLGPERRAALEQAARSNPGLRAAIAAYTPLGPAFEAALVERIAPVPRRAPVRARAAWRRILVMSAPGLAVAAGLALYLSSAEPKPTALDYDVDLIGGQAALRGGGTSATATAGRRFHRTGEIELVLRPNSLRSQGATTTAPAQVLAFLREGEPPGGARVRPVSLPFEVSPIGVMHLAGKVNELFPATVGPRTLLVLVSAAVLAPGRAAALVSGEAPLAPSERLIEIPLEIVAGDP